MKTRVTPHIVGSYVHKLAMERSESGQEESYWTAVHAVLGADKELQALYLGLQTRQTYGPEIPATRQEAQSAGSDLDKLIKDYMKQMRVSYETAFKHVTRANPQLTRRYQQV